MVIKWCSQVLVTVMLSTFTISSTPILFSIAVALGDVVLAREKANEYVRKIALFEGPSELRQASALIGEIEIAEGDYAAAIDSLAQADQSNPRILWLQALASQKIGDLETARGFAEEIVHFNEPVYGFALYFDRARELMG